MEHVISALIFPETEPARHGVAQLLLFFDALSYYLPTEPDGTKGRDKDFFTNLCTGHAPAPLGDDLARFNRLLRDMETSRPDELSRLFSAAKAPVANGQVRDQDETSAGSVYSALHKDAEMKTRIQYKERLWQARLILKLAEMLDRREAEIRQGLVQISSVEQKLFASLAGPGDAATTDLAELDSRGKLRYPEPVDIPPDALSLGTSALLIPLRLKAWAELFLADSPDQHPLILVATNPECGSILLDGFENTWRRDAKKLFSLSIPTVDPTGMEGSWDQYLASRNTFRDAVQVNMEYFGRFLQKTAALAGPAPDNPEEIPTLMENLSAWEQKAKMHFPGPQKGNKKLHIYCFPGIASAELFQRLFHLHGQGETNKQKYRTALLAILNS
jgi:hypothetical protein